MTSRPQGDELQTRPLVVVGIDGRPGSAGALRFAVAEAARRGGRLLIVHAVPLAPRPAADGGADPHQLALAILESAEHAARRQEPGVAVSSRLVHGSRTTGLVDASAGAALLVVGRDSRRVLDRAMPGTTTAAVAARALCEVVIIPSFWVEHAPRGRVVVGVEPRTDAHELIRRSFEIASTFEADLTLVTTWSLPDSSLDRVEVRQHAAEHGDLERRLIEGQVDACRPSFPAVHAEVRCEHGHPGPALLAATRGSDLLILARRHHPIPPFGHLGGVTQALLRTADVPVLVVPHPAIPIDPDDRVAPA